MCVCISFVYRTWYAYIVYAHIVYSVQTFSDMAEYNPRCSMLLVFSARNLYGAFFRLIIPSITPYPCHNSGHVRRGCISPSHFLTLNIPRPFEDYGLYMGVALAGMAWKNFLRWGVKMRFPRTYSPLSGWTLTCKISPCFMAGFFPVSFNPCNTRKSLQEIFTCTSITQRVLHAGKITHGRCHGCYTLTKSKGYDFHHSPAIMLQCVASKFLTKGLYHVH